VPVCTDTGSNAPNGTTCGTNLVCNAGTCTTCTSGAACTPTNACHTGTLSCSGGTPSCTDTGTSVADGTACGTNLQCKSGACCGIHEICNNGIDDNCDGLADCADPQCTAADAGGNDGLWQCAALPSGNGWTVVAYDASGRPACPADYATTATNVLSGINGAADTCHCNCSLTQAATCTGMWGWCDNGTTNAACCTPTKGIFNINDGKCSNYANNLATNNYFRGLPFSLATSPGKCGSSVTATPPAVTDTQGETCSLTQPGAGCSALSACVPTVSSSFKLCSVYSGSTTCPNGLIQSTVYTGYSDTRSCSSCTCGGSTNLACSATSMISYQGANCPSTGENWTMTESCLEPGVYLSGANGLTSSERVNVTTNGTANTCSVTANTQATGSVTPTGAITVCCLP
jgi:hypothetical protein